MTNSRRFVWLMGLLVLATVVTACGGSRRQQARIVVEWRQSAGTTVAALSEMNEEREGETMQANSSTRLAYANTPVHQAPISVTAQLVGRQVTNPFFDFALAASAPIEYERVSNDAILIDPIRPAKGSVLVRFEDLETVVPFAILPSAFISDHPTRYDWVQPPVMPGIDFASGVGTDVASADMYVDRSMRPGEVYAPYGFARLPLSGFWEAFAEPLDATSLQYESGAMGIMGIWEYASAYLWVVRTRDGGYARVKFNLSRWNEDWGFVYDYSPTGSFGGY